MQETFVAPPDTVIRDGRARPLAVPGISVLTVVILTLAILSYVLRFAKLDTVPLFPGEVPHALAAWKLVHPDAWTTVTVTDSPLLLAAQSVTFSLIGGHELGARALTALAGIALLLSPLLFQSLLGRTRAVLLCILLAGSPVMLLASRTSSPVVWSLLLAVFGLWAVWRYQETRSGGYAITATTLFVATALLAEPGGIPLLVMLGGAWLVTRSMVDDAGSPATGSSWWRAWPWGNALGVAALFVVIVATLLMLHQRGLSNIGALLGALVTKLTTADGFTPPLFALVISVFYETFFWPFALAGLVLAWRRGFSPVDRFFTAWLLLGLVGVLVYRGASPSHALWLTVPLAGLVSRVALEALRDDETGLYWQAPGWARWLVASAAFGLLSILSLAAQLVGRSMMRLDPAIGGDSLSRLDPIGIILVVMAVLFAIVGFFLVANIWDRPVAAQGGALGVLIFSLLTSLGSGWQAAVPNAHLATEPWHFQTTDAGVTLLRETLLEVAKRETRGFPSLPVAVQSEGDDLLAWTLRDFTNVRPVVAATDAAGAPVVVLTETLPEAAAPELGDSYLGQDFVTRRGWGLSNLRPYDLPAWWMQRRTTSQGVPLETATLWLRQDVYIGSPDDLID